MGGLVGPILATAGGYAFDTWTVEQGTSPGYVYRRLEDAHYARKTIIDRASCEQEMPGDLYPLAALCVCDTLEHFLSELVERGVLVADSALRALYLNHFV